MGPVPMNNQPPTQRPSRPRHRSRASKKDEEGEDVEEELDPLKRLLAKGWREEDSLMANKVFLCGPLIVQGRLYATDKLCLRGDFVVTDKLECDGTLTLHGDLSCWNKPAAVKNLVVMDTGVINGDMVVTTGAFIKGKCTINGKLTVTGIIRVTGTLKCKDLDLTGNIEGFGDKPQVIVEGNSVVNGKDSLSNKLVRLLREHEASIWKQGASLTENGTA